MAYSCDELRDDFARQTPVYDKTFLNDFISDMPNAPFMGRHMTQVWEDGASKRFFDKVHVAQPDYTSAWEDRTDAETNDCTTGCNPPTTFVDWGTTRDSYFTEHKTLRSREMCLDKLLQIPNLSEQITKIYRVLRKIPMGFNADFLRTRFLSYHDTLQIAGSTFDTLAITSSNIDKNATFIKLGSTALLPDSQLTWAILTAYGQELEMRGYSQDSGLPSGMYNLVTHSRTYQKLVGLNPELRSQLRVEGVKELSPLYKPGVGINADPFGPFAPTFDAQQLRYQHNGNGLLQRVLPYKNDPATTGHKPVVNPAYLNARYAISYILHPKAATLYTSTPKRIHPEVPTVNSAMWGSWGFVNDNPLISKNPDGTECTKNNELHWLFYWLCYLKLGFQYEQRDLVMPILHLIDGRGVDCVVNDPVCGTGPTYAYQDYSSVPDLCETD